MDERIPADHIRIEKMSSAYNEIIKSFKSYEQELVDFLLEDALDNQSKHISVTYLWFLKPENKLIGYITLLTDKISLSPSLKTEFNEKGILYKSLPAIKIGRLCVDDNFIGRGVGKLMMQFTIFHIQEISKRCGCRFITVDAKRNSEKDKDSMHFYKRMGFDILRKREKGTTAMYKDIFKIIEETNIL